MPIGEVTGLAFGTQTATTTAAALNGGTAKACSCVVLQNDPDNSVDLFVGDAASQPVQVKPGGSVALPVDDASKVFVKSASGTATVNWMSGAPGLSAAGAAGAAGGGTVDTELPAAVAASDAMANPTAPQV